MPDNSQQTPVDTELKEPESNCVLVETETVSNTEAEGEEEDLDLASLVGQTIQSKYEILELSGRGGMGAVYKARHKEIKRIVAIKVLLKHHVFNPETKARFREEATNAGKLNHANLIAVHDFGFLPGRQPYIVMDYLEGRSLEDVIQDGERIDEERFLNLIEQVLKGLAHAHGHGLVHRDIKPSNIMLIKGDDGEEVVKIVDFGIAKAFLPEVDTGDQPLRKFTKSGSVCGSPLYMSPENCREKPLDQRSDIYSLGCVMYEVLAGIPPLEGETAMDTMLKQIKQQPLRFGQLEKDPNVAPDIESMVLKCLAKDPNERYQSADQLKIQIKKLQRPKKRSKTTEQDVSSARRQTPSLGPQDLPKASAVESVAKEATTSKDPAEDAPTHWTSAVSDEDEAAPPAPPASLPSRLATEMISYIVTAGVCTAIGMLCVQQHYHLKELGIQSRAWVMSPGNLRRPANAGDESGIAALIRPVLPLGDGFYEYSFNGRQYASTRFSLYESRSGVASRAQSSLWEIYGSGPEGAHYRKQILERGNATHAPTGMTEVTNLSQNILATAPLEPVVRPNVPIPVTVRVDPRHPESATIVNGVGGDRLLFWFGTMSIISSALVLAMVAIRCVVEKPVFSVSNVVVGALKALVTPWLGAIIVGGSLLLSYVFYFTNSKIFYSF